MNDTPNHTSEAKSNEEIIGAESIYGANTRKGLVTISFRNEQVTVTPTEARAFAYNLLEVADAAQSDEFLMTFLLERVGIEDDGRAVQILRDFRQWRDSQR